MRPPPVNATGTSDGTPDPRAASSRRHDLDRTVSDSVSTLAPPPSAGRGDAELIVIAHPDAKMIGSRFRVPRQAQVAVGRSDNADLRLTPLAGKLGLVEPARVAAVVSGWPRSWHPAVVRGARRRW